MKPRPLIRLNWRLRFLFTIAVACIAVMALMLITGYIPTDGWGGSAAHHSRFALAAGLGAGCMLAVILELFGEAA